MVLGRTVVRLENYHYARKLPQQETRTHWFWHIADRSALILREQYDAALVAIATHPTIAIVVKGHMSLHAEQVR